MVSDWLLLSFRVNNDQSESCMDLSGADVMEWNVSS